MILADKYYKKNLKEIYKNGCKDENPRPHYKDGTPAHSVFITGVFETYDLQAGEFPITTLRNTAIKTGIREIFWIYQKQSNVLQDAIDLGINWWNEWDIGDSTIGKRYGYTVKKYDLMNKLLKGLEETPFARRHIMNLYQYEDMETPGLDPCAYETLFSVRKIGDVMYLDMTLNQRSNDYIMAGYINKIQYVALQMMIAGHLGWEVGKFNHYVNNLHIYDRHTQALGELLDIEPMDDFQPIIYLPHNKNFYDYTIDDFIIETCKEIPKLKSPLEIAI